MQSPPDKKQKRNEARMRVHEKHKEEMMWEKFEHHVIDYHTKITNHKSWHWKNIPEEHLYKAGYINDFNKHRLNRLSRYKDCNDKNINQYCEYGLDGIAFDEQNQIYHGIQAKYYTCKKVCASDIGTFLSVIFNRFHNNNINSKGYLYTTTNLQECLLEDIETGGKIIHNKLDFEFEDRRKSQYQHLKYSNEMNYNLRDYQNEAINTLLCHRNKINVLSLFCGGGKTLIAGHYLNKIRPKLIICIAPLRISVDNLHERISAFLKDYNSIIVDSDKNGIMDPDKIKNYINKNNTIVFTTYDSAENIINKLLTDDMVSDAFILGDEIHNITNRNKLCEFINRFKNGLLMTATVSNELYDIINCNLVYEYNLSRAIQNKWCVDYNIWLPLTLDDNQTEIDITIPDNFDNNELCKKAIFLITGMLKTGSRRCIVYCTNITDCKRFNVYFKQLCEDYFGCYSWCETIDCTINNEVRKKIISEFESEKDMLDTLHILTSVRILDEAIDIPRCDSEYITYVGVYSDDKRAVQRLQRGGRLDNSNINKINNMFIWTNDITNTVTMLNLLKDIDINFNTKIKKMNGNYNKLHLTDTRVLEDKHNKMIIKYIEYYCMGVNEYHGIKIQEIADFYDKYKRCPRNTKYCKYESSLSLYLQDRIKDKKENRLTEQIFKLITTNLPWFKYKGFHLQQHETMIQNLKLFYEKYNEEPVIRGGRENESQLAQYMTDRRYTKKIGKLSEEMEKLIVTELPWFSWDPQVKSHKIQIDTIALFYNTNNRPPKYTLDRTSVEYRMASYLTARRKQYKNNTSIKEVDEYLKNKLPWFNLNGD